MVKKSSLITLAAMLAIGLSAPMTAQAKPKTFPLGAHACSLSDLAGITATACTGWYEGNMNDTAALTADTTALNLLPGGGGFTALNTAWLDKIDVSGNPISFSQTMYGDTIVSFHNGAAKGQPNSIGYDGTAFYEFNAGLAGLTSLNLNVPGWSNAALWLTGSAPPPVTGVPEPAIWAMLLVGFGGLGVALRGHRKAAAATA